MVERFTVLVDPRQEPVPRQDPLGSTVTAGTQTLKRLITPPKGGWITMVLDHVITNGGGHPDKASLFAELATREGILLPTPDLAPAGELIEIPPASAGPG